MPGAFPTTPATLLSQLRDHNAAGWQVSWRNFLTLYYSPIRAIAVNAYRRNTGGAQPSPAFVEDVAAHVVSEFFAKKFSKYDSARGRLRTFLRMVTTTSVIDKLRAENPALYVAEEVTDVVGAHIDESCSEAEVMAYRQALLATLIEDLRNQIPFRQFQIFETVKLAGVAPEDAAIQLGVRRGVIDNSIYKAMKKLREIAASPEYQEEFFV